MFCFGSSKTRKSTYLSNIKGRIRFESLEERNLLAVLAGFTNSDFWAEVPAEETSGIVTVTTTMDIVADDGLVSLREAVSLAGDGGKVTFASSLNGGRFFLQKGEITINNAVTIDASNLRSGITVNGNGGRIFVNNDCLELKNVTLSGGHAIAGGAVINYNYLSLVDCTVSDNSAGMVGGGIYNWAGTVELVDSFFVGNEAVNGGAVWNAGGDIYITNCEFSINLAEDKGGAIGNGSGEIIISNSLVADNFTLDYYGGGLYNMGRLKLYNCTVANNYAGTSGGGIFNDGVNAEVRIYNSIVAINNTGTSEEDIHNFQSLGGVYAYYSLSGYTKWSYSSNTLVYSASKNLFTSTATGDYTLVSSAQAVNTGNNYYAQDAYGSPLSVDLAGMERIVNSKVDMGAYECGVDPSEYITVTGYNGTYDGTAHGITIKGTLSGDTILYSADGQSYSTDPLFYTNAGTYTAYVSITRADVFTYNETVTISISKAPITVSIKANDKVYDGTVAATGSYTLSGICSGDHISLSGGNYQFSSTNVGTGKTVTFRGYSLAAGSSNYILANKTATATGAISAKQLTVKGTTVHNKLYDGTTTAEVTVGSVTGICSGDSVNVTAVGQFSSAEVGEHNVAVTYSLSGSSASNYLAPASEILSASITNGSSPVDLDGDGFIGPGDRGILSGYWFSSAGDEDWNPACDIDKDGFIGPGDLSYISANWFKTTDDPSFINPPSKSELGENDEGDDVQFLESEIPTFPTSEEPEVTISLVAVAEPTENLSVLKTGATNFGTFYYTGKDNIPVTVRDDLIDLEQYYLEVWVFDAAATGKFVSSIQVQLDYNTGEVISLGLEDLYAGKIILDSYDYYDSAQNYLKAIQVAWLFSSEAQWDLMAPITNGENAWLLVRFIVTVDADCAATPAFSVVGVTDPVSPFVEGFYFTRTGENIPVDDSLISTVNVPSYSRLWKHSPDIDQNQIIATGDWAFLLNAWYTSPGDALWNERCDINGDDYIDESDLAWLINNWLDTWARE